MKKASFFESVVIVALALFFFVKGVLWIVWEILPSIQQADLSGFTFVFSVIVVAYLAARSAAAVPRILAGQWVWLLSQSARLCGTIID